MTITAVASPAPDHAELIAKYQALGFRLLYWERGSNPKNWKGPHGPAAKEWNDPNRVYDLSKYDPAIHNLGTFDGHEIAPEKYLADVDFDWAPGTRFAKKLLPPTQFGFGRQGKPFSHAIFTTSKRVDLHVYVDIADEGDGDGRDTFVELRGGDSARMTMIAPSLHSPGIYVELVADGEIAHEELAVLLEAVIDYAIACILYKRIPGGLHHDGRLALAGFLLKHGFTPERVIRIGQAVCEAQARDFKPDMSSKDVADMALVVSTTVERIAAGKKVAGGPKLAEFIGERGKAVVARIRKWIGAETGDKLVLDPAPMRSAQRFVETYYTLEGKRTLHNQNRVFYRFETAGYREHDADAMRAEVWNFLDGASTWIGGDDPVLAPFQPTIVKVNNVIDALRGVTNLPIAKSAPRWLANQPPDFANPLDFLAFPNGLLHIPTRTLLPPTPDFFTFNGVDFNYDPNAKQPEAWLKFLTDLWGDDTESIGTLQEVFGYFLTPDTHFQKIVMVIGPKRSGKSVMARILEKLVGERNTCKPTLSSFGNEFGKQSLINKTLAIIADARLGGRTDAASVAETLLSISGEDDPDVPRKFLPDWKGKLGVRFLLITNELPKISDTSGALVSRFIILALRQSFYGKEDLDLYNKLERELPSILNWALEGRDRLYKRRYFVQPESANDFVESLNDLSSPLAAFLQECTETPGAGESSDGFEVAPKELFAAWRKYCAQIGQEHPGTLQGFSRNVHAALPLAEKRKGGKGAQKRVWVGLRLNEEWVQKVTEQPEEPGM